jgi:hypothetical protein
MSGGTLTILPIHATPFAIVRIPDSEPLNRDLCTAFARRISPDQSSQDFLCYRSRDDLFEWSEEPIPQLVREILRGLYAVVGAVSEIEESVLQAQKLEARAWFTIVKMNGCVPAASYPLTAWCALYCVSAPLPSAARADSGALRLYESRLGNMFQDTTNSVMRIPFKTGHYIWRPVPGELVIFPASLMHEIALLRAPGELTLVTVRARFVAPSQTGYSGW